MRTFNDSWILNWASADKPLNLVPISRTASKNQGRKASELRKMTTNIVTVSFLSHYTAPEEYGGAFLFTFKAIIT